MTSFLLNATLAETQAQLAGKLRTVVGLESAAEKWLVASWTWRVAAHGEPHRRKDYLRRAELAVRNAAATCDRLADALAAEADRRTCAVEGV